MSDSFHSKKIKIAIVAGEKSGDELGGPLMECLKSNFEDVSFIGIGGCLLYTSPSPRDGLLARMPSSA